MLALKTLEDPLADAVTARLLDTGQIESVNRLFQAIRTVDDDIPEDAPPLIRDYLEETRRFPEWADPERIAHISDFYRHHQTAAGAVQGTAGLIGTYLSPMGAKTLHSTHALDHPQRRLSQSTRLFLGMGAPDAFTDHSRLIPTCQKVRLVHSAIRMLHERSGRWDHARDGAPVSQLYVYGATLVFSVATLDGIERLGIRVTDDQEDGFYYAWKLIAHWLGLPDQVVPLPDTVAEARTLWYEARDGGEWAPSPAGVILTKGCVDLYESHLPHGLRGVVPALVRQTLTDRFADMVEVPRSVHEKGVRVVSSLTHRLAEHHHEHPGERRHGDELHRVHHTPHVLTALGEVVKKISGRPADDRRDEGEEPQMADHV